MWPFSIKNKEYTLEEAKKTINYVSRFVGVIFISAILFYGYWFWIKFDQSFSKNSSDWGAFGDFFGGFMNPVISFFTLIIVSLAYLSQKEELHDTKKALAATAKAEEEQTEQIKRQNDLAALQQQIDICSTKLVSVTSSLQSLQTTYNRVANAQRQYLPDSNEWIFSPIYISVARMIPSENPEKKEYNSHTVLLNDEQIEEYLSRNAEAQQELIQEIEIAHTLLQAFTEKDSLNILLERIHEMKGA